MKRKIRKWSLATSMLGSLKQPVSAFLFDRISRLINQGNIIHVVYIDLNKGISICFLIETFTKLCTKLGNSIRMPFPKMC